MSRSLLSLDYLVRLFDGNLYETKEEQARSVLNACKQSINKNSQEAARKLNTKAPIRSIISSINPRRNTSNSPFSGLQFRKHLCETPPSAVSSNASECSDSETDIVSTSSESKNYHRPWYRAAGRSTFAAKRDQFDAFSRLRQQTLFKKLDHLDFLEGSEQIEECSVSEVDKMKEYEESQDSVFGKEKISAENIVKPDFVLPPRLNMIKRLQRSRSVVSENMFDVEELSESQIESKEELAKAALMKIIDRSYFSSGVYDHEEESIWRMSKRC